MPACSGRILYEDGSPAREVKVEGASIHGGMVKTLTRRDGSFDLSTSQADGIFTSIYAKGQKVGENVRGSGHIFYLK